MIISLSTTFFRDFNDIFMYESCVRSILGTRSLFITNNGTVGQRTNADRYWVRDGWQTNRLGINCWDLIFLSKSAKFQQFFNIIFSHWGPNDFFIHGWKKRSIF